MADKEKVVGFRLEITGVSNEDKELAKLEIHLRNIKKERDELLKQSSKPGAFASKEQIAQLAAYDKAIVKMENSLKGLKRTVDTASDSLARKKARLIELKQQYDAASESVAKRMAPGINKLTNEIKKAEAAVGTHSRGVGNYKGAIMDVGKQLIGFTSIAGGVILVVNKLKEAFQQTEQGTRFFGRISQQFKTLFQGIVSGEGIKESFKNAIMVGAIADKMDEIRKGDREDLKVIAQYETDINLLRLKSVDASLSLNEQKKALIEAEKKENELIAYRIRDKEQELGVVNDLLDKSKNDTLLLDKKAQLEAEIIQIKGSESLRLASKLSALSEKEIAETKKAADEKLEIERNFLDDREKMNKLFQDKWKKMVEDEKNLTVANFKEQFRELLGVSEESLGLQQNEKVTERNKKAIKSAQDYEETLVKESEDRKLQYKLAAIQGAEMGLNAGFEARKNRLQAEMQAELSQANLKESQKIQIQKKYAKEQQKIDIAQAIAGVAIAVIQALQTKPFIPMGLIAAALAGIQGGIQVATIKAQKYATGGRITSGVHVNTGTVDDTLIVANKSETVLTRNHVARLGGSGVMRRIGVPGYADGGYIGSQLPEVMPAGIDLSALARMINDKEVSLNMHKLGKAQKEFDVITKSQPI